MESVYIMLKRIATITIKDNIYEISASALRLSNGLVDKVNAIFNIENEWYKTTDPTMKDGKDMQLYRPCIKWIILNRMLQDMC